MQIDANKLIDTLKVQRNDALDALAMVHTQFVTAMARIAELEAAAEQVVQTHTGTGDNVINKD